jgi:glycosyltransferase involved in cell wall biosynthesis
VSEDVFEVALGAHLHQRGATPIDDPLLSVVVPVYNERRTLRRVVERVLRLPLRLEVVVVDDGSTDGSREIGEALAKDHSKVRSHALPGNHGKAEAVRAGLRNAQGDIIVVQDADLEYDPVDIPRLIEPIAAGHADVVYGTRLRGGEPQRVHLFSHYVGNRLLSLAARALYNTTISDISTGYKAFRTDLLCSFDLEENGFRFEPEVTARVLRTPGIRIYELAISYFGRTFQEGKKITWRDGPAYLWILVRERFTPPTYGQYEWQQRLTTGMVEVETPRGQT